MKPGRLRYTDVLNRWCNFPTHYFSCWTILYHFFWTRK